MTAVKATRIAKDGASTPAQFPYGFLDESGAGTGPFDPTHALLDSTGALINPATKEGVAAVAAALTGLSTDASVQAVRALLAGTLTVGLPAGAATDASVQAVRALLAATLTVGLPAGAATDVSVQAVRALLAGTLTVGLPAGAATDATLLAIKSALLAQIDLANLIVQDGTGAYYARRESLNEGTGVVTVSFTTLAGVAATPSGAITPILASGGGNTRSIETALFDATASGTGYSAGDVIARVLVYDTAANTIVASYWHDITTGTAIASAPTAGNLVEQARNLAAGASTSALQTAGNTALTAIQAAVTTPAIPTGAATSALQTSGNSTLSSILTTLQSQRSESLWTDDTGSYFVRVEIGGVLSWTDLSGNALSAPGTGARPAAGSTVLLSRSSFQAIAAGTGYSIGDYLDHFVTTDPSSGAVLGNFWVDLTTGAKLTAAPASGNISPVAALPSGAATSALQTTGNTALAAIQTAVTTPALPSGASTSALQTAGNTALTALGADGGLGTIGLKADTAPTGPTVSGSVVGVLKGIWAALVTRSPLDINNNPKVVLYDSTGAAVSYGGTTPVQGVVGGVAVPVSGALSQAGSVGTDASVNAPAIPNVGAAFGSSGLYANYVLVKTVAASPTRLNIDVENTSGAQIVLVRDDGTAAASAAPANASLIPLAGGQSAGAQGGSWSSATFKGRLQVYAPLSSAFVSILID